MGPTQAKVKLEWGTRTHSEVGGERQSQKLEVRLKKQGEVLAGQAELLAESKWGSFDSAGGLMT
jgi:hypothetical protein